ncbi:hypothetical protein AMTR_s00039p00046190 [Amborella trichopoda]|uniref:Uncharacterized protein n=1 Tax=Amborella trichopoda TaxID=13333 RepID=U5D0G2_AMBTC|nr:hypothetical protein AMTR_s00039p00046190 [Amborella trichopoda]
MEELRALGSRFFVWVGQQKGYRHPPSVSKKACELLSIAEKPEVLAKTLDDYKKEDGVVVSAHSFWVLLSPSKEAEFVFPLTLLPNIVLDLLFFY